MQSVDVKKNELLAKLRINREGHRKIFEEALVGYQKEVVKELERRLADARAGRRVPSVIRIDQPVNQTPEYDRAIAMLEMSVSDEITLTAQEFECYVMDRWHWKQQFLTSNSKYSSTASMMAQTVED